MKLGWLVLFSIFVFSFSARAEVINGITFVQASVKVDFAELELKSTADAASLALWTAADLRKLNQEQLDQLYARLRPGGAPSGVYHGRVLQFAPLALLTGLRARLLHSLAASLWSGKNFETIDDQLIANSLVPAGLLNRGVMKAAAVAFLGHDPDFSSYKQLSFLGRSYLEVLPSKVFFRSESFRFSARILHFGFRVRRYDPWISFRF